MSRGGENTERLVNTALDMPSLLVPLCPPPPSIFRQKLLSSQIPLGFTSP